MKPPKISNAQADLLQPRLSKILNPRDPLLILTHSIDWDFYEREFSSLFKDGSGQPPKPIRLMVGIIKLQHMEGLSDEEVVAQWTQNPYWQYFCGYDHLQWGFPIDPSSLTHWRQRLGEDGLEKILSSTVQCAIATGTVKQKDLERVIVDTTVMEKNITHPTDSKLLYRVLAKLVAQAKSNSVPLRQSYVRVSKRALHQAGRYGHAKQFKRMKKEVKRLKTYLGRVVRDIDRKIQKNEKLQSDFEELLGYSRRLLAQTKKSKNKLYSLHAPEVACISKGKANKPYEFGCKVSLVLTHKQGLALSSQGLSGAPYDGHTLSSSLSNAAKVSGQAITRAFVDRGYKGHGVEDVEVFISGQKRGMTRSLKKQLKRRSAIEPHIGHMKEDGKLRRNYLKGAEGDRMNAIQCGIGHNLRMILRRIRILFVQILEAFYLVIRNLTFNPFNLKDYGSFSDIGCKILEIKLMAA